MKIFNKKLFLVLTILIVLGIGITTVIWMFNKQSVQQSLTQISPLLAPTVSFIPPLDPCAQTSTSTSLYNPKIPATWPSLTVYYVERVGDKELPIRNGIIQAEFINISDGSSNSITQGPSTNKKGNAILRHLQKGRYKINAKDGFRSDETTDGSSYYTQRWGSKTIDFCFDDIITIKTETPSPPLATPIASTTLEIISGNQVKWNPANSFATTIEIDKEDFGKYTIFYNINTIGIIKDGRYKNKELLRVDTTISGDYGPCKGLSCGNIYPGARFVKNDQTMIFLPKISSPFTQSDYERGNPFEKIGLDLIIDPNFSISILEFPATISGSNPRQHLISNSSIEEFGNLNTEKLIKIFHHEILGDIYTTIPDINRMRSFYYDEYNLSNASVDGCNGESCFLTNGFFVFRPDGTFLKYFYRPDFSLEEFIWNENTTSSIRYDYVTYFGGCSKNNLDYNSIVHPAVLHDGDDIVAVGHNKIGDIVYALKNNNHPLLLEFYKNYKKYFIKEEWYKNTWAYQEPVSNQLFSYDEFLKARPILFWHDPFGRIIRFQNNNFLPPGACEPIIYLYPSTIQKVSVLIQPRGRITDSTPNYNSGWEVIAEPSGKIRDISSQKVYSYLFWEGWSWIFPMRDKGFVVSQSDIHKFFSQILPKLGLKDNEANDFMLAWEPSFVDAPYYFITFYDKDFIDYFAPLIILPKPDVVIRVLMDYKPLDKPISVKPINIHTPERRGFTVVEWGGLVR